MRPTNYLSLLRSTKHLSLTLLFLFFTLLFVTPTVVNAADDNDEADEITARVMRISLLSGDVNVRQSDSKEWEKATLNLALVEGDTLQTEHDARLEIQVDARNFVRVGADSLLRIVTLRDEGIALSLVEGTATIRLARFDKAREYFEVDAPDTTLAVETQGLYRLDVSREGRVRLTASDGGRARIYSETSGFTLRDGKSAELVTNGTDAGDWDLSVATGRDDWDSWVMERERYLSARLRDNKDYYDDNIWGAEELDAYGDWDNTSDYGWVWRPHVTVINNYNNWAPYRYGNWRWCAPYGWTWVGDEPWGWAPYHYGRWVYHNNSWCWTPRGYQEHHSRWRPALVAFVNLNIAGGGSRDRDRDHDRRVAWYPLGYHQRYNRNNHERGDDHGEWRREHADYQRAVTVGREKDFGRWKARHEAASQDIARRAVESEHVEGRLAFKPHAVEGEKDLVVRGRRNAPREGSTDLSSLPPTTNERSTFAGRRMGAAERRPGVALNEELQRTRLYNGRDPRSFKGMSTTDTEDNTVRPTGAVARPPRPNARPLPERINEPDAGQSKRGAAHIRDGVREADPTIATPARHPRSESSAGSSQSPDNAERTHRSERGRNDRRADPSSLGDDAQPLTPQNEPSVKPERPARTEHIERPAHVEQPAQPARVERAERPEREERRHERESRPERSAEPQPRPERHQEARPEPRAERNEPPPRQESKPEPSHSEPQHQEQPQKSSPPPERHSEPSRPSRKGSPEDPGKR
jgi:hypothetical protein